MGDRKRHEQAGMGTTSVHGADRGNYDGPLVPPVHQSSTFVARSTAAFDDAYEGRTGAFIYSRDGNPTTAKVAEKLALLEGTERALLTGSGMGAISTAVMALTRSGGRVVTVSDLYGGTARFFRDVLPRFGVTVDAFPTTDTTALEARLEAGPADVVYLESPSNPSLNLVDVQEAVRLAREHDAPTVMDNTFATPVNQRPRELGVDVVVHSATKTLNGHSDILAGAVCADGDLFARILAMHKLMGATLDAHAAFLLDRGLRTLPLRAAAANANARAVAEALEAHDAVTRVRYPGLPSHPQHALAKRQMPGGFGSLVTFDLASKEAAYRFADNLEIIRNAASLGGVESLVSIPVVQSHRGFSEDALTASGISPGTVRLALGVEDAADLVRDVERGLAAASG